MTKKLFDDDIYKYLKGRLDELSQTDNASKYLGLLIPVINLLWEQEVGRECGGKYTKEFTLNKLKIRITHNE